MQALSLPNTHLPLSTGFAAAAAAAVNTVVTSERVALLGHPGERFTLRTGGEGSPQLSINSGSWGTSGNAVTGDTVRLRLTAGPIIGSTRTAWLGCRDRKMLFRTTVAAAWSPAALGTLLRWFKADTIAGSDGDSIGTWNDDSPNLDHATASGGDRGVLKTGILNGMSVLRYASAVAGYSAAGLGDDLASDDSHSWFFVIKPTLAGYPVLVTYPYGGAWSYLVELNAGNGKLYFAGSGSYKLLDTALSDATWAVLSAIKTGAATCEAADDGTVVTTGSGTIGAMNASTGAMQLLGYTPSAAGFVGDVAEIVCLNGSDTDEARKVEGYLAWKWGLQANLPGGHTYASAPP